MRWSAAGYVALALFASCSLPWCNPDPLKPDICVSSRGVNGHGDLVMATPPPAGTTACKAMAPVAGRLTSTHGTDVSRTGMCKPTNDPWAELTNDDAGVRVCMFYNCTPGTTNVFDCYESSPGDSRGSDDAESQKKREKTHVVKGVTESGFTGCCRTGKGRVTARVQCSGIFAAKVEGYLWVESASGDSHDYSVLYDLE
ncbi:MAG: hypothetical protein JO257_03660 [Deltaproteobacteria bacterium]|nr:hypothetical protein [Deltaproteobacteria bacterium]